MHPRIPMILLAAYQQRALEELNFELTNKQRHRDNRMMSDERFYSNGLAAIYAAEIKEITDEIEDIGA